MEIRIKVCDLCKLDGEPIIATGRYYAPEAYGWFDICDEHLAQVGDNFQTVKYELPGDVDMEE